MTYRIYWLVITGMSVIALLAVIRSFSGGTEVAALRLGWGGLSFTFPGMWDLLGIIGSVLWVGTRPGTPARDMARRSGIWMTLLAVTVVGASLGAEGYFTATELPGGWPYPALAAGVAIPCVYAWLTHVAAHCRLALEAQPSTPPEASDASPSTPSEPLPVSSGNASPTTSPAIDSPPPSSSAPTLPAAAALTESLTSTPEPRAARHAASTAPEPSPPATASPSASSGPETAPDPSPAPTASAADPSTEPRPSSGRTTLPADFFGTSTPAASSSSSSETRTSESGWASDADTDDLEVVLDVTDLEGKDPTLPASYGRDGKAPPEVRRQWIRDKRSLNIHVTGAQVDKRFGAPRTGARLLRDVQAEPMVRQ